MKHANETGPEPGGVLVPVGERAHRPAVGLFEHRIGQIETGHRGATGPGALPFGQQFPSPGGGPAIAVDRLPSILLTPGDNHRHRPRRGPFPGDGDLESAGAGQLVGRRR